MLASIFMGASLAASMYLARNFRFKLGDYIEKYLTKVSLKLNYFRFYKQKIYGTLLI